MSEAAQPEDSSSSSDSVGRQRQSSSSSDHPPATPTGSSQLESELNCLYSDLYTDYHQFQPQKVFDLIILRVIHVMLYVVCRLGSV